MMTAYCKYNREMKEFEQAEADLSEQAPQHSQEVEEVAVLREMSLQNGEGAQLESSGPPVVITKSKKSIIADARYRKLDGSRYSKNPGRNDVDNDAQVPPLSHPKKDS